jgi:hypothetical protein
LFLFLLRKTELVARKQGGYTQKASAGKELQPEVQLFFRRTRRADRAPSGHPYNGITLFFPKERLARPIQEMIRALWFLRITALLPGRAMPAIQ